MPGPARTSDGTLFLDEITEMSPTMQVKLLRVIQENEVLALGATAPVKIDVRFIAATNRDVQEMVKQGGFRQDLYRRLNVVNLHISDLVAQLLGIDRVSLWRKLKRYEMESG